MTDEAPRPLERAAGEENEPAPRRPSRVLAGGVLLVATLGAVIVASLSTSSTSPRGAGTGDTTGTSLIAPASGEKPPAADLALPVIHPREHGASPFDAPTTDSAVTGCTDLVRGAVGEGVEIQPLEPAWGDIDPTKGRTDSLILEGRAGSRVWHCAAARRSDGAVERIDTVVEEIWSGAPPRFDAVHALTVAAEESCMRRGNKLYPGFVFRGVTRERRGDSLYVAADAIPIENDLVRDFSCIATVRGGRVMDATAKRSR